MERKIGGTKGLFPDPAQVISGNGATQLQGCSASAMGPSWLWGVWGVSRNTHQGSGTSLSALPQNYLPRQPQDTG